MPTDPPASQRSAPRRRGNPRREPLHLWRTSGPDGIDRREADRLAEILTGVELLGEPRWRAARSWDAAEAAGVALRHLRRHGAAGTRADIAMSAVLLHALRGCATSRAVVVHARRRRTSRGR
jgi:hypothetical protein